MKKLNVILLSLHSFLIFYSITAYYPQQSKVFVYSGNVKVKNTINNILRKFNIDYENVQSLYSNEKNLYIIAGEFSTLNQSSMPKYYIVYQANKLAPDLSASTASALSHATAIWDSSRDNINKYKNEFKNYYYLPNENYDFLDPIILPCFLPVNALNAYKKILEYSNAVGSDISMHLPSLFCHCIFQKPELIIEAGIRWGNGSTIPLYTARELLNAFLVGIDINDCAPIYSKFAKSFFFRINDLEFPDHLKKMNLKKDKIDFVFIDTTHDYNHTLKEINMFVSILSENGTLGFHDSNSLPGDPDGVKIALKKYFNLNFDESKYGNYMIEKDHYRWNIVHYPFCNGMTIAKRIKKLAS